MALFALRLFVFNIIFGLVVGVTIPTPTYPQLAWQDMELGAIIHFNMATSAGTQGCYAYSWDLGGLPPLDLFNPTRLNTDQWLQSISDLGAKYAVYVAKHSCGFATWPVHTVLPSGFVYDYSVGSTPKFKGNVVKDFIDSSIKYGIRPGFYYSVVTNAYLNVVNGTVNNGTLSPGQAKVTQEEYNEIVKNQLTDLWSHSGDLAEIWFDGGYADYLFIGPLLQKLQPYATAFNGYGLAVNPVRWVGNEMGVAPYPTWSTGKTNAGDPNSIIWNPAECDTTLQNQDQWFYNSTIGLRNLTELQTVYHRTVGRNANLLLDFAPGPDGLLPLDAVRRYKEFGDWIRECYDTPIAQTSGVGIEFFIHLPPLSVIDRVVIREDQSKGQRVREFYIYILDENTKTYIEVGRGSSVGNKRIHLFDEPVTTTSVLLVIKDAIAEPHIRSFGAYLC